MQFLTPPNLPNFTAKSILYVAANKDVAEDTSFVYDVTNNRLGVGTVAPIATAQLIVTATDTNTSPRVLRLGHNTSATPLVNFGLAYEFGLQSTTNVDQTVARFLAQWADPTHATRLGKFSMQVYEQATARTAFVAEADTGMVKVGFLGAAAVPRAAAYTQTYATAGRTVSAYTSDTESSAYVGLATGLGASPYASVVNLNALRVAYENLRASHDELLGVVNSLIDDMQLNGLVG